MEPVHHGLLVERFQGPLPDIPVVEVSFQGAFTFKYLRFEGETGVGARRVRSYLLRRCDWNHLEP